MSGFDVDPDHLALRTDELGEQQGDFTGAAAEVEDLHPARDPGGDEELPRERTVDLVLQDQPPGLCRRPAERIAVLGYHRLQ